MSRAVESKVLSHPVTGYTCFLLSDPGLIFRLYTLRSEIESESSETMPGRDDNC